MATYESKDGKLVQVDDEAPEPCKHVWQPTVVFAPVHPIPGSSAPQPIGERIPGPDRCALCRVAKP